MLRWCSVRYFVEIHELQTELSVFKARGVANFGTRCICKLDSFTRWQRRVMDDSVATMWRSLTFWRENLISSSLSKTYWYQWQKVGENTSTDTGDVAITYSLRWTDRRKHRQRRAKHIASDDLLRRRWRLKILEICYRPELAWWRQTQCWESDRAQRTCLSSPWGIRRRYSHQTLWLHVSTNAQDNMNTHTQIDLPLVTMSVLFNRPIFWLCCWA